MTVKKKLSGSARRKLRRQRLAKEHGLTPELLRLPDVDGRRLETVNDWRTQISLLYRSAVRGELPEYLATKLVYIAQVAATLAKAAEELQELTALRQQLEQLRHCAPTAIAHTQSSADFDGNNIDGELMPSAFDNSSTPHEVATHE